MNVITLVGRAGRDPEAKYFENGNVVANVSLAVNGVKRDADADWFALQIWGKQAQVAVDYVRKGSLIGVSGRMTFEKWTDRNTGEQKSKPVVVVERLTLLGSKADNQQAAAAPPSAAAPAPAVPHGQPMGAPPAAPGPGQAQAAYAAAGWQPPAQQQAPQQPGWNEEPPF